MSEEFEALAMKEIMGEASDAESGQLEDYFGDPETGEERMKQFLELQETYCIAATSLSQVDVDASATAQEMPRYLWNEIREACPDRAEAASHTRAARSSRPWWSKLVLGLASVSAVCVLWISQFQQSYRIQFADYAFSEVRGGEAMPDNVEEKYFTVDQSAAFEQWQASGLPAEFDAKVWVDSTSNELVIVKRESDGSVSQERRTLPTELVEMRSFIRGVLSSLEPAQSD